MNTLVIVLAKGASTRVPQKNIALVGGRPLLHYTFDYLRAMRQPADFVVLTESLLVAAQCQEFRVCRESTEQATPLARRAEIAVQELEAERRRRYDYVLLTNADTPVRPRTLLDDALGELKRTGADVVQSAIEIPISYHPWRSFLLRRTGDLVPLLGNVDHEEISQNYPRYLALTGGVFAMRRDVLPAAEFMGIRHPSRHFRPIVCAADEIVEIDTPEDLEAFRRRVEHGNDGRLSRPLAGATSHPGRSSSHHG